MKGVVGLSVLVCAIAVVVVAQGRDTPSQPQSGNSAAAVQRPRAVASAATPTLIPTPQVPTKAAARHSPARQAQQIVEGSYPTLVAWKQYLARSWRGSVATRWTAQRISDTRWIARLKFSRGKESERGSWTVMGPIGAHPTKAQIRAYLSDESLPVPRDATARRFSGPIPLPAPRATQGRIKLNVYALIADPQNMTLIVDPSPPKLAGVEDERLDSDQAVLRGLHLRGLTRKQPVKVMASTRARVIRVRGTRRLPSDLTELSHATGSVPVGAELTWSGFNTQPRSLTQLLQHTVSVVAWNDPH